MQTRPVSGIGVVLQVPFSIISAGIPCLLVEFPLSVIAKRHPKLYLTPQHFSTTRLLFLLCIHVMAEQQAAVATFKLVLGMCTLHGLTIFLSS